MIQRYPHGRYPLTFSESTKLLRRDAWEAPHLSPKRLPSVNKRMMGKAQKPLLNLSLKRNELWIYIYIYIWVYPMFIHFQSQPNRSLDTSSHICLHMSKAEVQMFHDQATCIMLIYADASLCLYYSRSSGIAWIFFAYLKTWNPPSAIGIRLQLQASQRFATTCAVGRDLVQQPLFSSVGSKLVKQDRNIPELKRKAGVQWQYELHNIIPYYLRREERKPGAW